MNMSLRTFCIIPHESRDDNFFDAVFEDGLRVLHSGRLHSLSLSHVLSPAHDIVGHVVGPLLEQVRQGGNATLIVAIPDDENGEGDANGMNSSNSSNNTAAYESHNGGGKITSGEELEVAFELYAHFIPLLFRAAEQCCFARVSAVAFRVDGKTVYDLLQQREVRGVGEAQYHVVEREGSSSRWGAILRFLQDFPPALVGPSSSSSSSSFSSSVVVVRVELAGYGAVGVVRAGGGADALQQFDRLLRSGGGRTFPPRGPLTAALRNAVPPAARTHFVGIPTPRTAPRGTMRLLRCMAELCRETVATPRGHAASLNESVKPQKEEEEEEQQQRQQQQQQLQQKQQVKQKDPKEHPYAWSGELFVDPSQCLRPISSKRCNTHGPNWDWGTARPEHTPRDGNITKSHTSPILVTGEEKEKTVDNVTSQNSREQALVSRAAALDRTNRELVAALSSAKAEVKHLMEMQQVSQEALRQKQDALLSLTASSEKAKEENVDYAKLVPRLLRKVKDLEKERDSLRETIKEQEVKNSNIQEAYQKLQDQFQRLQKEMKAMSKKETQRLREQALKRIGTTEDRNESLNKSRKGSSHIQTRRKSKSPVVESSRRSRSASITPPVESGSSLLEAIEELRERNTSLETELRELRSQKTIAAIPTSDCNNGVNHIRNDSSNLAPGGGSAKPVVRCSSCDLTKRHLQRLSEEFERTCKEKERLQCLLTDRSFQSSNLLGGVTTTTTTPTTTKALRDAVSIVATSIMAGCESLRTQLEHLETEVQRHGRKSFQDSFPSGVFREHMEALAAVSAAVQDINSRRYRGVENYERIVPSCATAADTEQMSSVLSFEVERGTRLRAFIPTFAQLSVATEHLRMRVFPAES
ncbi:uncharacterized protein TM35_000171330 [Trypanosoma theileri]|uniref:Kinesin motor domain-containing protein n=1 Tax=Trypanosoma theileri TaxID=67003 RepID=A0A1X0NUH2_9TRYP|nr:uncharacterized protein TM35_000171330 [Trypanosoma theileri]ORC88261.1 hypothetical protein TM35_000171330 [Trypanosoma theileri]